MDFCLRNALGFFIQIFSSMLLLCVPFSDKSYRISRKKTFLFLGIAAVAESLLFPLLISLLKNIFSNILMAANIYMVFAVVILVISWLILNKEGVIKKLIAISFSLIYAATQYMLVNLFTENAETVSDVYPMSTVILYIIVTAVLFPIFFLIVCKAVKPYLEKIEPRNMKSEFRLVLLAIAFYLIETFFFSLTPLNDINNYWWFMSISFIFVSVILCLFYWVLFRESIRKQKDEENTRLLEIQQIQYHKIVAEMNNAKRMRHDFRYHVRCLSELAAQNNTEAISNYLSELSDETHRQEDESFCKNDVLNGILQYYIGWAREYGISCDVSAVCSEEIQIKPVDLTVIFGNILENAIKSCKQIGLNSFIDVKIGTVGNSFAASISNSCKSVVLSDKAADKSGFYSADYFASSRKDGGYGLRSVEATAAKYDGDALFSFDEEKKIFTTRVRLNIE